MATKITALPARTASALTDILPTVDAAAGTPATQKVTVAQLRAAMIPVQMAADVAGTLPVANGGTGLPSFGSPLQYVRVNAGGTALEYATLSAGGGTPTGTGFYHTAGGVMDAASKKVDLTAAADVTVPGTVNGVVTSSGSVLQQASNVLAGTDFVSIGASPAAAGVGLRVPSQGVLKIRNNAGGADLCLFQTDTGDNLWLGCNNAGSEPVNSCFFYVSASHDVVLGNAATAKFAVRGSTGFTENSYPMIGGSGFATGSPYGMHGMTVKAMTGTTDVLTNAEYKNNTVKVTGTGTNVIKFPAAADAAGYRVYVWNAGTGTLAVQDTNSVAAAATLASGQGAWFLIASSAVKQLTAAFAVA